VGGTVVGGRFSETIESDVVDVVIGSAVVGVTGAVRWNLQ